MTPTSHLESRLECMESVLGAWRETIARVERKVSNLDPEALAEAVIECIKTREARIVTRLETVETRLATFEAKPHVKFCGVWEPERTYTAGDAATHHGSLWICKAAAPGEPSKDFAGWQLAVKRGSV